MKDLEEVSVREQQKEFNMPYVPVNISLGRVPGLPNGRHIVSGNKQIYIRNGKKHRDNGPAEIRRDGYKAWFKFGVKHRSKGPAVIHPDGTKEYWVDGKFIKKVGADG